MPAFSTEERQLLHDSATDFFADRYGPDRALALARADGFGRAEWADYAALGWLGLMMPEALDGADGGLTEAAILFAAAGRGLSQEPLIPTMVLGAGALARIGGPAQAALLKDVAAGARVLAFMHAEPDAGYARDHVRAVAARTDAGWALSGAKRFALGAQDADALLVSARIGGADGPVGLFVVPADAAGVTLNGAPALDGRRGAAARFDAAALDADALLGDAAEDRLAAIDLLLDHAALAECADAVGAMTEAAARTAAYLKTREQFGKPLASFQVLQHRLADMHIACEESRAVTHAALTAVDEGDPDARRAIWTAKVHVARAARFVGGQSIQMHGGMGMTDDMGIGLYYKRLSVFEAMHGDADWHVARLTALHAQGAAPALQEA